MRHTPLTIPLLLCSLACTSGDNGKVRPPGESAATPAPDTTPKALLPQPAPTVKKISRPAQRAWDTAAPESFDVEEVNRRRAEPEPEKPYIPLTKSDTLKMLAEMKPDEYGAYGYLKPSEYPDLPPEIAGWLEERDFVIPQIVPPVFQYMDRDWTPCNAIRGEFIRSGQTDWAVYCTNGQETKIFVFENLSINAIMIIETDFDNRRLLGCCDLWISKMAPKPLAKYNQLREGQGIEFIPEIDHNGIALGDAYRSFYVMYYYNGKWCVYSSTDDE